MILRIPWVEHASDEEVLSKIGTERKFVLRTKKRQLKLLRQIIRAKASDIFKFPGCVKGNSKKKETTSNFFNVSNYYSTVALLFSPLFVIIYKRCIWGLSSL